MTLPTVTAETLLLLALVIALLLPGILVAVGLRRTNFQEQPVLIAGCAIGLWSVPAALLATQWSGPAPRAYALVVGGFTLLGLADDLWGNRKARGLKGHALALIREHRLTTGGAKAFGGAILTLVAMAVILGQGPVEALVDAALVALAANTINLLDLRPGRASAVSLLALGGVALAAQGAPTALLVCGITALPVVALHPMDARARTMLGDSGSNPLGAALGLAMVLTGSWPLRLAALALFVALHALAERTSISALVEASPILRRLDRLTGVR